MSLIIEARISDYGIEYIEKLDTVKAVVTFDIEEDQHNEDFKYSNIKWDGLFTKKDGSHNQKTVDSLVTMGFRGEDPIVLNEGVTAGHLNNDQVYNLTLTLDGKYWKVEWINLPGSGQQVIKKMDDNILKKKLAGMKLKGAFASAIKEKGQPKKKESDPELDDFFNADEKIEVKNFAPGGNKNATKHRWMALVAS